jgi:hypothetical protein
MLIINASMSKKIAENANGLQYEKYAEVDKITFLLLMKETVTFFVDSEETYQYSDDVWNSLSLDKMIDVYRLLLDWTYEDIFRNLDRCVRSRMAVESLQLESLALASRPHSIHEEKEFRKRARRTLNKLHQQMDDEIDRQNNQAA